MFNIGEGGHLISLLYRDLKADSPWKDLATWCTDLGEELTDTDWGTMCM